MAKKKSTSTSTFPRFMLALVILPVLLVIGLAFFRTNTDFRSLAAAAPPKVEVVAKGEAGEKNTVKTETVKGTASQFYLASISMKPYVPVSSVSGLGLKWTKLKSQCSSRESTGTEVWMATGTVSQSDGVTAVFSKTPKNSVMAVTGLSGVYLEDPISGGIGLNTNGVDGKCSGGQDSKAYEVPFTTENNVLVLTAMGTRLRSHTPGVPFTELLDFNYGKDNGDKAGLAIAQKVYAKSEPITVKGFLNSATDWSGVVVQVHGIPERISMATPTPRPTSAASPVASAVASAKPSPTAAPSSPTPRPSVMPSPTPTPPPVISHPVTGVWTSPTELRNKPMSGEAWNSVKATADALSSSPSPDLDNQDDSTNVEVLAAAIVYARTGDAGYKTKVVNALQKVEQFTPKGRTLAWARETGAYAIAADLVGYRTPAFEKKMRDMAETYKCSQLDRTLLEMYKLRPNNWGSQAFGSLAAIYSYLGDKQKLAEIRQHYAQSVNGPTPSVSSYGSLSWQCNSSQPRWINPKNCSISCGSSVNVDGIIPDDMRRGGNCQANPLHTGYPWEGLQGFVMAARILDRAGMSIWQESDRAICRAASALQDGRFGNGWRASGDDEWQLPFLDAACGTNWSAAYGNGKWSAGKNAGWGYVLP